MPMKFKDLSLQTKITSVTFAGVSVCGGFLAGIFNERLLNPSSGSASGTIWVSWPLVLTYGGTALALLVCAFLFSRNISNGLMGIGNDIFTGNEKLKLKLQESSKTTTALSNAAQEQASAIQQTAASIEEVSAMAKKSSDNAEASQKVSEESRIAAEDGQAAIREMIDAIRDISRSNGSIMEQVEAGNRQISEIVKVISEIESKTKVINDIVFQTKLLSFNASVEAARAGEHGKGFAVVAEEVGNLAQMSGNAAKEISAMLGSSIQKVEGIVLETKSRVESLVIEGRSKVEKGTEIAQKCGSALEKILAMVQQVDGMVAEIASASKEQSQGVSDINKSITQLDHIVQQNSEFALRTKESFEEFELLSLQIQGRVQNLFQILGKSYPRTTDSATSPVSLQKRPMPKVVSLDKKRLEISKVVKKSAAPVTPTRERAAVNDLPSKDDPRFEDI